MSSNCLISYFVCLVNKRAYSNVHTVIGLLFIIGNATASFLQEANGLDAVHSKRHL